jgi:hypothetical protein
MDAKLAERIAIETAHLPNRRAWPEIYARLILQGASKRELSALQQTVREIRKQNATEAKRQKSVNVANVACE